MSESQGKSLWVWVPLGLALGLFVAFILFLDEKHKQPPQESIVMSKQDAKKERAKPVFDFYTVLPDRVLEIDINEIINETKEGVKKPLAASQYILQVGSFNNFADADELKAQLAFMGLEANLAEVKIKNSQWYRVELGPFASSNGLSKTKNVLIKNKIKYLQKKAAQ